MKFSFLSNAKNSNILRQRKSSWQWLPCHQPRTLSFRTDNNNTLFTIITSDSIVGADDTLPLETVIRGLRSDRLFFEPGETSSIMEEATKRNEEEDDDIDGLLPFKESLVLSMDSRDPYVDFRVSMEEMVEAQGLNDWEGLEQLLFWYLRAHGKCNHDYIVTSFVDSLVARLTINVSNSIPDNIHSPSSPLSFDTSPSSSSSEVFSSTIIPCVCPLEAEKGIDDDSHRLSSSSPSLEVDQKKEMIIIKGTEDDDASSSVLVV
ncbi:putative Ovate family protein [Hibiscus syriacus]|uniref:Transcription repressor n=1 Tax=Hibiscus syriacus TaxID=106335 RepID=A0A6A2ZFI2_HIBSY|nr:transcription repressor OFP15-like [Hibiscus syriacus]KAE8690300.1 putative Ovate family protein [Hibiscus syriacus]